MSLLDKIAVWRNAGSSGADGSKRLYIVDGASLGSTNGGRARLSPRAQLDMLHRLSRFAKKESLQIETVFEGEPLRKVADKSEFKDVMVRFAGSPSDLAPLIVKMVKENSRRREVVVITSDKELEEKVLASGGTTVRSSTFNKGLDAAVGGGDGNRNSGDSRRRRPRRGGRRSGGNGDQRGEGNQKSEAPRRQQRKRKPKDDGLDDVRELIDLVEEVPKQAPQKQPKQEPDGNIVQEAVPDEALDEVNGNQ